MLIIKKIPLSLFLIMMILISCANDNGTSKTEDGDNENESTLPASESTISISKNSDIVYNNIITTENGVVVPEGYRIISGYNTETRSLTFHFDNSDINFTFKVSAKLDTLDEISYDLDPMEKLNSNGLVNFKGLNRLYRLSDGTFTIDNIEDYINSDNAYVFNGKFIGTFKSQSEPENIVTVEVNFNSLAFDIINNI